MDVIILINLVCVLFGTAIPTSSFNLFNCFLYLFTVPFLLPSGQFILFNNTTMSESVFSYSRVTINNAVFMCVCIIVCLGEHKNSCIHSRQHLKVGLV